MPFKRVLLDFARYSDAELSEFYTTTYAGLDGNAAFPELPVALADYQTLGNTFIEKLAASADGGKLAKAERTVARAALVGAMRLIASYVQAQAGNDLPVLLTSGFLPVVTNNTQSPLAKPVVDNIDNFQSTMVLVRLKQIPNMRAIEVRRRVHGIGEYQAAGLFTRANKILQEGLTPGTSYDWQFRAIGGSTGYSDWSDPVTHMAT